MKRLQILFLALLPAMACAQEPEGPRMGVNVGGTLANIRGNEGADSNNYAADFLVGFSIEVPITDRLWFMANANYERKSFSNEIEILDFDPVVNPRMADVRATFQYISLPVNMRYYLGEKKNFFVNAGPFVAIFLDDTFKLDGETIAAEYSGESDFKSLDFGLTAGIGTRIRLTEKNSLNIELRDNLGLVNISEAPMADGDSVKTNSINLILTYDFKL